MLVHCGADQVQDSRGGHRIRDRSSASSDSAARVRVAKREDSYGRISGPKAGSRASSPGEQAAACDYQTTRALGREQAAACDYIENSHGASATTRGMKPHRSPAKALRGASFTAKLVT